MIVDSPNCFFSAKYKDSTSETEPNPIPSVRINNLWKEKSNFLLFNFANSF